jgi:chromosome segregation ATPase
MGEEGKKMHRKFIVMGMIAILAVGCAGPTGKGGRTRSRTSSPALTAAQREEAELDRRVKNIKENLEGKEKGLSKLSESLQAKELEKKAAHERLLLAQKEIEVKDQEMDRIRISVESSRMVNKEIDVINATIQDITSATGKEQESTQRKVEFLSSELETIKGQISQAEQQRQEKNLAVEKERIESEAQLKRLEQEILERQKAHRSTKARLEGVLMTQKKEQLSTDEKVMLWKKQIERKEARIGELKGSYETTRKGNDSEISTLRSKAERVQKEVDRMLQKKAGGQTN